MATELLLPDASPVPPVSFVPPLESGDRLTRDEFERRYGAMPGVKKAELIQGVVYMPSPVKNSHGESHSHMVTWLGVYTAATPGVRVSDNATVRLDAENEPQPDVQLRIDAACGGQTTLSPDDYIEGAPELAAEIAGTSAAYDLHDKRRSAATACANTWSGASTKVVWIGSAWKTKCMCPSRRTPRACCAAVSSRGCGWTGPR